MSRKRRTTILFLVAVAGGVLFFGASAAIVIMNLRAQHAANMRSTELNRQLMFRALEVVSRAAQVLSIQGRKPTLKEVDGLRESAVALDQLRTRNEGAIGHSNHNSQAVPPNWFYLSVAFAALVDAVTLLGGFMWYIDRVDPGRHFEYPDRDGRSWRFGQFCLYSMVLMTSFGTTEIRPIGIQATALAYIAGIMGIVYVLFIITLGVSIFTS